MDVAGKLSKMSSHSSLKNVSPRPPKTPSSAGQGSPRKKTAEKVRRVSFKGVDKRSSSTMRLTAKRSSNLKNNQAPKQEEMLREILRSNDDQQNTDSDSSSKSGNSCESAPSEERKSTRKGRKRRESAGQYGSKAAIDDIPIFHTNLPAYVIAVANRMKEAAIKRRQDQTKDDLNTVMHRIKMALHHSGNDFTETTDQNDVTSQEIIVYGMPDLDIEREREKRDSRQKVVEVFKSSMKRSKSKVNIIQDLHDWFLQVKQSDEVDDNEMEKQKERHDEVGSIHKTIMSSMNRVKNSSKKLKKIAKQIMAAKLLASARKEETGGKDLERETKGSAKAGNERKMLTAQELGDRKNWPIAIKKVALELDDFLRMTHQEQGRKHLQSITKQVKIFGAVMENKLREINDTEKRLQEKTIELQKALNEGERMQETIKTNIESINAHEEKNGLLKQRIEELEGKMDADRNAKKPRTRERRRSVLLPTGEGLAKPNSIAEEKKQNVETRLPTEFITEQIKSRLGAFDDAVVAEEDNKDIPQRNEKQDAARRHTLAAGQLTMLKDFSKAKKRVQEEKIAEDISEEVASPVINNQEGKIEEYKTVIKTLESTTDSLRKELANSRKDIERQALKIIELETELTGREALEQCIEQVELEKSELEKQLQTSLTAYERELEVSQNKADNLTDSVEELRNNMRIKEDQIGHLQRCLDTMTADMQTLLDEKIALEQRQVNQVVKIELGDSVSKQQLLVKLKKQYEGELQRLRDFLAKEHQRYLAEIRRNETQHRNDILTIHKGSMQLLKTVNRFKDSLAMILERESLNEAAFELRQLEPLPIEPGFSSSTETKQMLSMMAYQATELLVSLENRLSKALLSRRLEVKEATTAKGFVVRDLENQSEKLRKARETLALQTEKMKTLEDVNRNFVNDYQELSGKYKALQKELSPYQQLIENHMLLKKEFERVQTENREAVRRSTYQLTEIERDRAQLKRVVQSQQEFISKLSTKQTLNQQRNNNKREQRYSQRTASMFYIAKTEQERNLKRLDKAFASDQITSETHEKAATLIKKTMDLPRLRFVHLVRRYLAYDRMQKIKQAMKMSLIKYKNNIRLSGYIKEMESRIEEKARKWEERKAELVEYRATLLLQMMDTFSSVQKETGLLLVEPLCKTTTKPAAAHGKEGRRLVLRHEKQTLMPLAESIVGKSIKPVIEERCTMWQQSDIDTENETILMPRIVDLDINRWKYSAKSMLVGDINEIQKFEISKAKMEKIKRTYAAKLRLPPIASIYPEKPQKQDWLLDDD